MTNRARSGVFLSYARKDGEEFAALLRTRLEEEVSDVVVRQDRNLLEGGVGWWKQLTEAIDSVEFLVLVMSPSAMRSEMVRKEWRYARQQGVCVYPVKAAPGAGLNFPDLPRWMRKAHFFDLDREWETFVAHLRRGCATPRVPFMAPDLPENFTQRPDEFERLKGLLLSGDRKEPVAITTALAGGGGFGKTTLAAALCHDEDIVQNFDDGILWVTLGQNPNVMGSLVTAYAALTGERPGFASEEDAAFQLGQKLEDRTCLLVVDDVWDEAHLRPFLRGAKGCARLFTTRMTGLAPGAHGVNVEEMSPAESLELLTRGVQGLDAARAQQLGARLGEWPLALELAVATMRQRIDQGDSAERAAQRLVQILDKRGFRGLSGTTGAAQHRSIDAVLAGSLELLSGEDRARFTQLSIFPEDIPIPLTAAAALWGLDDLDAEDCAQRLSRLSLLKLDLGAGWMRLHDVIRSWLAAATPNGAELHSRLVDAWPDWMHLPEVYAWRWLPWHMVQAGRTQEIEKILWDPRWLKAKLDETSIHALIADFDHLKPQPEAKLIQDALRLSSHVLAKDPSQFASQMIGRLLPHEGRAVIAQFTRRIAETADRPWLRLLKPALDPAGSALLRTLAGHSSVVHAVAITPDGRRAVSASWDMTLKIWDLESGTELRTLEGHSFWIDAVAITPDGRRAVSGSEDLTLKVWDLDSGAEVRTLQGHSSRVISVAVTPDGRRAVSGSWDRTLKVWDLESGVERCTLEGHCDGVSSVAVTPDGRRAVSASYDKTLKVWDLESGVELHTLEGHSRGVTSVAVTPDGRRAVSASSDKTLKVWDLESGAELRTLGRNSSLVNSVAVTPDGRRAVSTSADCTLQVWDLGSGGELHTLEGHSSWVSSVAVTPDGRRAVSGSEDRTLKVWDLESRDELRTLEGHSDRIMGVAVTPDGLRAVSGSGDNTLKVWDLESGAELRTLKGHSSLVTSVAVTPDGRRAVSGSLDNTLKVWDLESGTELHTLAGHSSGVLALALTPDGLRVVSGSNDETLKIWDPESGTELHTLEGHSNWVTSVAVTPDGRRAVSASVDNTLKVWDLESGAELRTLEGHLGRVYSVAVTPDGRRALSGSNDKTLKVWDLDTGDAAATFAFDAPATCCAWVDNRTIVAGDGGGRIYFLALEIPG